MKVLKHKHLFYVTSLNLNNGEPGAVSHVENIILGLHDLGWDITLFSCHQDLNARSEFPFAHHIIKKSGFSLVQQILEQVRLGWRLITLKNNTPGIIYIRFSPLSVVAALFSLLKQIPCVVEMNAAAPFPSLFTPLNFFRSRIQRWILTYSTMVITTTEELKRHFVRCAHINAEKVWVIPMGFESHLLEKSMDLLNNRKNISKKTTIGFLGQLHQRQGIMDLIEAIPQVVKHHKNVRFAIAGKGRLESALKKRVQELNIQKYVQFLGMIDAKQVPEFLDHCDLTVAPYFGAFNSQVPMGSPSKIIVYLACAKPVVASALPGLKMFETCRAITFCEPDSPVDLAKAISQVITLSWEKRRELGLSGQNFVKHRFSWDVLARKTSRLMEATLS